MLGERLVLLARASSQVFESKIIHRTDWNKEYYNQLAYYTEFRMKSGVWGNPSSWKGSIMTRSAQQSVTPSRKTNTGD